MDLQLKNKLALVTGSTAGIGFAGDLSTAEAAEELGHTHPDVEILINNLGIYEAAAFAEITE